LRLALSILFTALAVLVMKLAFRRRRPEGTWGAVYRGTDPHSFPSGHAARAVLIATLVLRWGPGWLAIPTVLWAPSVALARVALGVHYLSDVLAGGLLGLSAAALTILIAG
jgi:undecaprenyl-diphosphatase